MIEQPFWLLLIIVFVVFVLLKSKIRRSLPFSLILVATGVFIILGLSRISVLIKPEPREFVILIDNSKSMQLSLNNNFKQIEESIAAEFASLNKSDQVTVVTFSNDAEIVKLSSDFQDFHQTGADVKKILKDISWADDTGTNLLAGLKICSEMLSKQKPSGILVITDCGFTDEVKELNEQLLLLRNKGINTKLINLGRTKIRNVGFIEVSTPQNVFFDEIAVFTAKIRSEFNTKIILKALFQLENEQIFEVKTQLFFNDTPLNRNSDGEYEIEKNVTYSALAWGKVTAKNGVLGCKFRMLTDDETSDDNSAETKAFINSGKSVLIYTNDGKADYISEFLRLNFPEIEFTVLAPEKAYKNLEDYLGYRAIIFSDVKKSNFINPDEVFQAITKAVDNNGVNFAMTGGRNSFAPGGYLKTEIERILPVEFDPNKNKQRAIVISIDRSESMNNAISSSTRIAVVGEAARKFINNLDEKDLCSFMSFADAPDNIGETLALSKLTTDYKQKISDRIDILSKSRHLFGRTNIEAAIYDGIKKLRERTEKIKVILIFSDGEPTVGAKTLEEFKPILKEIVDENIFLGFAVAGTKNELFSALAAELKDNGSVEFLQKSWDINTAFNNALLKAGGKIIKKGEFQILNPEKQVIVDYPLLKGYVRSLLKNTGSPEIVALTDKNDPLIVNWRVNEALTSAYLIPFNDYDLIWERQVPSRITALLKDNFFRLFAGETVKFNVEVVNKGSKILLKVTDSQENIIRELKLKINDKIFELKPENVGEYVAEIDLQSTSTGIIFGQGIQQVPVVLQPNLSMEYQNINGKKKLLRSLFEKHFPEQSTQSTITELVQSKEVEGYELTKLFNILALISLIFWAFLFAFKPRN